MVFLSWNTVFIAGFGLIGEYEQRKITILIVENRKTAFLASRETVVVSIQYLVSERKSGWTSGYFRFLYSMIFFSLDLVTEGLVFVYKGFDIILW